MGVFVCLCEQLERDFFSFKNDLVLFILMYDGAVDLQLFEINDFSCGLIGLSCRCCSCNGRCRLLFIGVTFGLCGALFALVRYSNVLTQTVLVLEGLLAVLALPRWLRCVLGSNMTPEIHWSNHQLTILTLGPFTVRLLPRLLVCF